MLPCLLLEFFVRLSSNLTLTELFRFLLQAYTVLHYFPSSILILYFHKKTTRKSIESLTTQLLFIFDTLGLAAFTMDGVNAGMAVHTGIFLPAFLGVMTGVGGGIIRDVLANELPQVCVKQIYASASIVGSIITCLFIKYGETNTAVILGFIIVVLIRVLAAHYRWDLPTIEYYEDKQK